MNAAVVVIGIVFLQVYFVMLTLLSCLLRLLVCVRCLREFASLHHVRFHPANPQLLCALMISFR